MEHSKPHVFKRSVFIFLKTVHTRNDTPRDSPFADFSVQDGDNTARRATVATDPSSILMFSSDPENAGQPLIGQFQAGAKPQEVFETISAYEYKIANASGLASSAIKSSGDPRSGYSLSVSRDSQRETARKYAPIFSYCDSRTFGKIRGFMQSLFRNVTLPESGYRFNMSITTKPRRDKSTKRRRDSKKWERV